MYCISFLSTNYTLLAEKYLKENDVETMIIPTPREITKSCGMSIKIDFGDINRCKQILRENQVQILGVFSIENKKAIPV